MAKDFLLGCHWRTAQPWDKTTTEDLFRQVHESDVFDYMDWLPRPQLLDEAIRCSQKYGVPMHTGTYQYMLGRDEAMLDEDMRNAVRAGLKVHNIMIYTNAADGYLATDDEIVATYLHTAELGDKIAPDGPPNLWAKDENGNQGRGIQYRS